MQIINKIPKLFSDDELHGLSQWVYIELGAPEVKSITFNHDTDNFKWDGYAWFIPRTMRVSLGKKQGAMYYKRNDLVIDPCGKDEIAIVAITHEMQHIKQQSEEHSTIYSEVYRLLKLWRKENGGRHRFVRRILFLVTELRRRL